LAVQATVLFLPAEVFDSVYPVIRAGVSLLPRPRCRFRRRRVAMREIAASNCFKETGGARTGK
jgi:hypothetical protein